jgi:uncharacterized membrane protein/mono/diheme cytochrome c family protein
MILTITDFIAPLHPVLVHLPIGILLLACLFQWLSLKNRFAFLQAAVPVTLFLGMIGAVVSCISGYLLSQTGDYDEQIASSHQWFGIGVAAFSFILYILHKLSIGNRAAAWLSLILALSIIITGHLGGTLTHGEGYLIAAFNPEGKKETVLKPIPNLPDAVMYGNIVQPVLQAKCYGCHGTTKQKGKLRLDSPESILKGGKDGKVLIPGKTDESEMIKRILLPTSDGDHMPPKAKPQLTDNEIQLLQWWVSTGADFNKKVKELQPTEKIKPVLVSLQTGEAMEKAVMPVPDAPVDKADEKVIDKLRQAGVVIIPVGKNSNYLLVNFVSAESATDSVLHLLVSLKKQLVWLKLDNTTISDAALDQVASCTSITRLQLNNTGITDKGLLKLQSLKQLQSLSLVGTKVTAQGVLQLQKLPNLKNLYLYQTGVVNNDWVNLKNAFPKTQIDSGKYVVPTFVNDTTLIKY